MTIKEQIMDIIKNEPGIKDTCEDNTGCLKNIIIPAIENADDDQVLKIVIDMLISHSIMYDMLINNIAVLGSGKLIEKCNKDINSILIPEE